MPIVEQKFQFMLLELAELLDAHLLSLSKRPQISCNLPGLLVVALFQELVWDSLTPTVTAHFHRNLHETLPHSVSAFSLARKI